MSRPNKMQAVAKRLRNKEIMKMGMQPVSLEFLSEYFGLTKPQISKIIKSAKNKRRR